MELGFRIPNSEIPDSKSKIFLDFGIQIPLHGANVSCGLAIIVKFERQLYTIGHWQTNFVW